MSHRGLELVLRHADVGFDPPWRVWRQPILQIGRGARGVTPQVDGRARNHQRGPPVHCKALTGERNARGQQFLPRHFGMAAVGFLHARDHAGHRDRAGAVDVAVVLDPLPWEQVGRRSVRQRVIFQSQAAGCAHAVIDHFMTVLARAVEHHRAAAAKPAHPGLQHAERKRGRDHGIDAVAARRQHFGADLRGFTRLRGNDAALGRRRRFADLLGVGKLVTHAAPSLFVVCDCCRQAGGYSDLVHHGYWLGMSVDTLPGNEGGRFSRKALTPSRTSAWPPRSIDIGLSMASRSKGAGAPAKRQSICRVNATATADVSSVISRAISRARCISSAGLTTSLTRPPCLASSASKVRPERHQRSACGRPTSFGRNQALPASGTRPRRAKMKPILAPLAAIRISIGKVMVMPTPTAGPLIAAIDGFRQLKIASINRPPPGLGLANTPAPWLPEVSKLAAPPETSAPAQKARPAPVTMTARTLSSVSARSKAWAISAPIWPV